MTVTAGMVKELREKTGAGMMDCKSALNETAGDMEAAVDWLRTKGLAKAAKKAGRVAAEGLIGVASRGKRAVMVEVNSETDFVARNAEFQKLVAGVAEAALGTDGSLAAVQAAKLPGSSQTVEEAIKAAVATIGEASGHTSTMPAHVRSSDACSKIGNSSSAAAIWCSITWNEPRCA